MTKVLKWLKVYWLITAGTYLAVYLVTSFVLWEFKNPFWWIIEIPQFTTSERSEVVLYYFCWSFVAFMVTATILKKDGGPNEG